jgi:archaellum component FlaC
LIEKASQKQIAGVIMDHIEKSLDTMLGHVKMTLEEVASDLSSAAISATNTMDEFCDECRMLTKELAEAAEAVAETVGAMPILQGTWNEGPVPGGGGTYVDMAKKMVPPMHADTIVRGEMQK